MWYKLFLLLVYFVFLFLLARLLEVAAWCGGAVWYQNIIDPMSLSVLQLKSVLESRGVDYETEVEKNDLLKLVDATGVATSEEIMQQISNDNIHEPVTNFTHGLQFLEEVEDKKDSVWLVQVKTKSWPGLLLAPNHWLHVHTKTSRFGIRAGVFDCTYDPRFCASKGWTTPRLILALPQGDMTKASVSIITYTGRTHERGVIDWVRREIEKRIIIIDNVDNMTTQWLAYKPDEDPNELRIIFFAKLAVLPLLFSALSFKFPGRAKFAVASPKLIDKHIQVDNVSDDASIRPQYMVITQGKQYVYGFKPGEIFSFKRMELFLKTLYPEINDLFIFIMFITNWLSLLEMTFCRCGIFRRLIKFIWHLIKYNVIVIVTVLPTIAIFRLPYLNWLVSYCLKVLQTLGTTSIASYLRKDLCFYSSNLLIFFLATGIFLFVIAIIEGMVLQRTPEPPSVFWDFSNFVRTDYLLSPFYNFSVFGVSVFRDESPQIELIMNQMVQPSLWLQPSFEPDPDYINHLPTWKFEFVLADCKLSHNEFCECKCPCDNEDCILLHGNSKKNRSNVAYDQHTSTVTTSDDFASRHHSPVHGTHYKTENRKEQPTCCVCSINSNNSVPLQLLHSQSVEEKCCPRTQSEQLNFENSICSCNDKNKPVFPDGFLPSSNCVICLEEYAINNILCGLPCGHSFHSRCIIAWLTRDNHFCPICRWPSYRNKTTSQHAHHD